MAIKITVSDIVACKVAGELVGANGPEPFDFTLYLKRLDTERLRDRLTDSSGSMVDFLADLATGWKGVRGDSGEEPFSADALRELMKLPNLAQLAFDAYLRDVGAKAKN